MSFADAPRCTHITVTGHRCGSPALRNEHFCYFHTRMVKGVRCRVDMRIEPYALLESPAAIQAALINVYSDILQGQIDYRKASLLLKALQIAATLSRRVDFEHAQYNMVTEVPNWDQQFLDEHPEYGAPKTAVVAGDVASYVSTTTSGDSGTRVETQLAASRSAAKKAPEAVRAPRAACPPECSEAPATLSSSTCHPEQSEGPAVSPSIKATAAVPRKPPQPAHHSTPADSTPAASPAPALQSEISNQKSAIVPPPGNPQTQTGLSARQLAQWKDIARVERALADARKGNLKDLKTCLSLLGLSPNRRRRI